MADTRIRLFLSHSSKDKTLVRAVGDQLTQIGYQVWLDENHMVAGDRIHAAVESAVDESDYLILFITEAALGSFWVDEEWRTKFEQQLSERRVRVLPVVLTPAELPPSLRGRIQIRSTQPTFFLRTGYKEIDRAVREHERRIHGGTNSEPKGPLNDPGSATNIIGEVDAAFDQRPPELDVVVSTLRSARESAIVRYDIGNRDMALSIYAAIISLVFARRGFWFSHSNLPQASRALIGDIKILFDGNRLNDVWASRMILDEIVDFFYAESLLSQFLEITPGMAIPEKQIEDQTGRRYHGFQPYWWPFEHLRYAMEGREGFAISSFPLLRELCDVVLLRAETALSQKWEAGDKSDLHEAVVLRMVRWPGAKHGLSLTEQLYPEMDGSVGNSVNVLWDIRNMDMCNFPTGGFWRSSQDRKDLLKNGSLAAFDRGLSSRGYPRDSGYWTNSSQ